MLKRWWKIGFVLFVLWAIQFFGLMTADILMDSWSADDPEHTWKIIAINCLFIMGFVICGLNLETD